MVRLFAGASPPTVGEVDDPVTLGLEFFVTERSEAAGVWYFQPTTGTVSSSARTCAIYEITGDGNTGTLLYSGSLTPSGSGWQRHKILDTVLLDPAKRYKAAVFHPAAGYVATGSYFSSGPGGSGITNEYLTAPSSPDSISDQGSFFYGASIGFPNAQFNQGQYWVDIETRKTPFLASAYGQNPDAAAPGQYTVPITVPAGIEVGDWIVANISWSTGATTTLTRTGWQTVLTETQANNMWTCVLAKQYTGGSTVNIDIGNGTYSKLWVGMYFLDGTMISGIEDIGTYGTRGGVSQTFVTAAAMTADALPRYSMHLATCRAAAASAVASIAATGFDFFLDAYGKSADAGNVCSNICSTSAIPSTSIPAVTTTFNGASGNALALTLTLKPYQAADAGIVTTAFMPSFDDTNIQVGAILTQGDALRIAVATDSALTDPDYFDGTIASSNWATARATGLTANTKYFIGFEIDGVLQTDYQLTGYTTGPDVPNFTVIAGSCQQTGSNHASLARVATENARFLCHMGDIHYADALDETAWRAGMLSSLTTANMKTLMKDLPMDYIWDNHDRISNDDVDTDEVNNGTTNALTVTRFRELAGTAAYPVSDAQYRTWRIGRVRFIHTDAWTLRDDPDIAPDTGDMFGPTQIEWIKDTLEAATEPVIVWFCSFPNHNAHNGRWNSFEDETAALDAWISTKPGIRKRLIMVGGDSHDIKADSGTRTVGRPEDGSPHHNFIGVPTLNASGFDQGSNTLWDTGNWDIASITTGDGGASYSRLKFADSGDTVHVTWEAVNGATGEVRASYERQLGTIKLKTVSGTALAVVGSKVADTRRMVGAAFRIKTPWPALSQVGWQPTGVSLTPYVGGTTLTGTQTIDSKTMVGHYQVAAGAHITITRCNIIGRIDCDPIGLDRDCVIEYSEIYAGNANVPCVGYGNITIRWCNLHGGANTVIGGSNTLVEDTWMYDQYLGPESDWHENAFLSNGGDGITVRRCVMHANQEDNGFGGGVSTDCSFFGDFGPIANVLVEDSFLKATPGAYGISLGYNPAKPFGSNPTNVIVRRNVFQKNVGGFTGVIGTTTGWLDANGNLFEDNVYDDGTLVIIA